MSKKILSINGQFLVINDSLIAMPDMNLQDKTVTPRQNAQVVVADAEFTGLNKVTVEAMPAAEQATPVIEVDDSGLITASTIQDEGYVVAGTKSATKQLPVQEAQTIMPGATDKTIEAGKYLTGIQTIKGDANLIPENIAKDAVIFGITGVHQGGEDVSAELTEQDDIIALMQEAIATKSAAGVAEPFAFIAVTYSKGSICICTDGVETLTAKNTDGTYVFCVSHDGEWTVTSTDPEDSTKTKSQIVEITEEGQFENIELEYGLVLFAPGATDKMSIGFTSSEVAGLATLTVGDTVKITSQSNGAISYMSNEPIDLTNYSVIKCDNVAYFGNGFLIIDTIRDRNCAAEMPVARTVEASLPVDTYTGSYYIGITCFLGGSKEIARLTLE